ncbi:extracellular solute-binding protein family 3 [Gloeothece citriformis PCC 7424]|uniref:Extracellular solute-binding protein family 3 n=1 Tax=Gloeothece citriformis (strain PCC 7424) TaxID=65393 RepID=B7KDY0_GLOC7|nr:extracellular substrate binding-like orphan protein GrrP [Gloeothece citriformis]ACK71678.1 extracellular solute-binding protein family 3 [Gloeothece citriformis PCC 7424]
MKKLTLALLSLAFTLALPLKSGAETVLERVARTGVLTVGTPTDIVPLAYVNEQQELVGYSVDFLNLLKDQIQTQLGREIALQFVEITPSDGIPKLMSEEVDIICNAGFSWERDKFVDFSLSMGISGTQILVKQNTNLGSIDSLKGKRVAAIPKTIAEQVIRVSQPDATVVTVESMQQGFEAVEQGKVDAFAADGIILEGYQQTVSQPNAYKVVPEQPYNRQGIACMVPENNSKFLDTINFTIVRLMQGYLAQEPSSVEIIERWFGSQGIITVEPELIRNYFQDVINSREQIFIQQ